jgi:hypothetical protein
VHVLQLRRVDHHLPRHTRAAARGHGGSVCASDTRDRERRRQALLRGPAAHMGLGEGRARTSRRVSLRGLTSSIRCACSQASAAARAAGPRTSTRKRYAGSVGGSPVHMHARARLRSAGSSLRGPRWRGARRALRRRGHRHHRRHHHKHPARHRCQRVWSERKKNTQTS